MNAIKISDILQESGFEIKQANTLAKLFTEETMEKRLTRLEVLSASILAFGGAGFGYLVSPLNTIIEKI